MRLSRRLARLGLGIAMLLGAGGTARAQPGNCSVTSTPVAFGTYNVFDGAPLDSTGNIHIVCNGWMRAISVWLSKGSGPSTVLRQMVSTLGTGRLDYNLYLDAGRTQVWGDPNPYNYNTEAKLFFLDLSLNVYGRIRPQQDVAAGTYTDTVTASINF